MALLTHEALTSTTPENDHLDDEEHYMQTCKPLLESGAQSCLLTAVSDAQCRKGSYYGGCSPAACLKCCAAAPATSLLHPSQQLWLLGQPDSLWRPWQRPCA